MQNIPYQTFKTAEEAIASKAIYVAITTRKNLGPLSGAEHIKALKIIDFTQNEEDWDIELTPIANMPNLEALDLSENRIAYLPKEALPKLKYLDWSNSSYFECGFDAMATYPMLETLILQNCQIFELPTNLPPLEHVTKLDIRKNSHALAPLQLFPNLKELLISEQTNMDYDQQFEALAKFPVTTLDLLNNRRKKVSKHLEKFTKLTSLNIQMKSLADCEFLSSFPLESLQLKTPNLPIDDLFEHLPNTELQTLTIQHPIECLPEKIIEYKEIENLSLMMKYEDESPSKTIAHIAQLPKLKKLHLDLNKSNFPEAFADLSYVEHISLRLTNDELFLPKGIAFFEETVFESNKKALAKKLNAYIQTYGKDNALSDAIKTKYFAIMLDQKQIQQALFPFQLENIEVEKTVFFVVGVIEGYSQKEIKDKIKEYGYKVATKLNEDVTHVLLGKNVKAKIMEQVVQSNDYKIVIEAHLKKYFIAEDKPFLMEEAEVERKNTEETNENEQMNENIIELLLSDDTNAKLGLSMMEDGGATKKTLTVLYVFLVIHLTKNLDQEEKEMKKHIRKVFKRYASPSLVEHLKIRKNRIDHPELDTITYLRVELLYDYSWWLEKDIFDKIGWEGIGKIAPKLPKLKDLHLRKLQLKEMPADIIPHLSNLRYIDISDNEIQALPKEIEQLEQLETLYIDDCNLTAFPSIPPNLLSLSVDNNISVVPKEITQHRKLEYLSMKNCNLTAFPSIPPNLKSLNIENNDISEVPDAIKKCEKLENLHLNNCNLTAFPSIPPNLLLLTINNNNISEVPDAIKKYKKLENLYLNNCKLTAFPSIPPNLKSLNISENEISELPNTIETYGSLKTIFMKNCQLEDIGILPTLESLEYLNVMDNPLKKKPTHVTLKIVY